MLLASCNTPSDGTVGSGKWQSYSGDKRIEARVDSILKLMTLEEKIGQMTQFSANWSVTGPVMSDDFNPTSKRGW